MQHFERLKNENMDLPVWGRQRAWLEVSRTSAGPISSIDWNHSFYGARQRDPTANTRTRLLYHRPTQPINKAPQNGPRYVNLDQELCNLFWNPRQWVVTFRTWTVSLKSESRWDQIRLKFLKMWLRVFIEYTIRLDVKVHCLHRYKPSPWQQKKQCVTCVILRTISRHQHVTLRTVSTHQHVTYASHYGPFQHFSTWHNLFINTANCWLKLTSRTQIVCIKLSTVSWRKWISFLLIDLKISTVQCRLCAHQNLLTFLLFVIFDSLLYLSDWPFNYCIWTVQFICQIGLRSRVTQSHSLSVRLACDQESVNHTVSLSVRLACDQESATQFICQICLQSRVSYTVYLSDLPAIKSHLHSLSVRFACNQESFTQFICQICLQARVSHTYCWHSTHELHMSVKVIWTDIMTSYGYWYMDHGVIMARECRDHDVIWLLKQIMTSYSYWDRDHDVI